MFIKPYACYDSYSEGVIDVKVASKNETAKKRSGIIDSTRQIFIFYDETLTPQRCKVIQINLSASRGKEIVFDGVMNRYNSTLSFAATYVYDLVLNTREVGLLNQFMHGYLYLVSAKRIDRETDYDMKLTKGEGTNFGTKRVPDMHGEAVVMTDVRPMVRPEYYTLDHAYNLSGDLDTTNTSIKDLYGAPIYGWKIMDENTKVFQLKPADFETIMEEVGFHRDDKSHSVVEAIYPREIIRTVNGVVALNSLVANTDIVWDGVKKRIGVFAPRRKDSGFLFSDYITDRHKYEEIVDLSTAVEAACREAEHEYGTIQAWFHPSIVGTKCKVVFMDRLANNLQLKQSMDSGAEIVEVVENDIFENPANDHWFEAGYDGRDTFRSWRCNTFPESYYPYGAY